MRAMPWSVIKKQLFLPTRSNWRSNYPRNHVLVQLTESWRPKRPDEYLLHVSAFGTKDFGVHRWVRADRYNLVYRRRKLLTELTNLPQPLSIKWMLEHGYYYV